MGPFPGVLLSSCLFGPGPNQHEMNSVLLSTMPCGEQASC